MNENLSLYHIEQDLAELMGARDEELQAINEGTRKDADGLAAIDQAIKEYAAREVAKVDSIRGYLRWAKVQADAAEDEAERQDARAKLLRAGMDRLKEFVVSVMNTAGKKAIEGKTGKLMVKGNGGVEPLVIADESLIPDELCWMEGRIRADLWLALGETVPGLIPESSIAFSLKRVPSNTLVREALAKDCSKCHGHGALCAGCLASASHCSCSYTVTCESCAGTGRAGVPGARLEPRGQHLETR